MFSPSASCTDSGVQVEMGQSWTLFRKTTGRGNFLHAGLGSPSGTVTSVIEYSRAAAEKQSDVTIAPERVR